ncbi:MAG TPA: hypothetical protein VGE73_04815 [Pseudolabrys sp.]
MAAAGQTQRANEARELAARELAALWQRIGSQHIGAQGYAACGFGGMMLQASDFELDIVEFVIGDASKAKRPEVEAFIDRVAKRGPDRYSLPALLDAIATQRDGVASDDLDFVLARLRTTLTSIEAAHNSARFVCD